MSQNTTAAWIAAGALAFAPALPGQLFEDPIRIEANGKPISTDVGHSAPYVCDFDRDGVLDLLVGQFGEGKLRIYRNDGTNDKPVYGEPSWFEGGGTTARVPAG